MAPDSRFPGQLLAAQGELAALTSEQQIAELTCQTLADAPGVRWCRVCFRGTTARRGDAGDELCRSCPARGEDAANHCALANRPNVKVMALESVDHVLGFFVLGLDDPAAFGSCEPLLGNFANFVALLLSNRSQEAALRETRRTLRHRGELSRLVARTSCQLVGAPPGSLDADVSQALRAIAELEGADRAFIFRHSADGRSVSNTHEWCAAGIAPQRDRLQDLDTGVFPWLHARLLRDEAVVVPSVGDLPHAAAAERAELETADVRSIILVPFRVRGRLAGVLGLATVRTAGAWSAEIVEPLRVIGEVVGDVTERQGTEEALGQQQRELDLIFNSVPATIWFKDKNNRILRVNRAAAEAMGMPVEDIEGKSAHELFPEEADHYYEDDLEVMSSGQAKVGIIEQMQIPTGEKRWVRTVKAPYYDDDGNPAGVVAFVVDVTAARRVEEERRELEKELLHAQKMEIIGVLAGGIAHDFNNILWSILGYSELVHQELPAGSRECEHLELVLEAAKRAQGLVQQILTFSQKAKGEGRPVGLPIVVEEGLKLLRATIPSTIEICSDIDPRSGIVLADPTRLHQILMNLCTNAFQAMSEGKGTLTVTLNPVEVDGDPAGSQPGLIRGSYACLTVGDTGAGMSPETLARIFDPFFTTRTAKGSGLGLAIVKRIVRDLRGTVTVESREGRGSNFHVYLPRLETGAEERKRPAQAPVTGTGRILYVDDDSSLAKLGGRMLESLGYQVTVATRAEEALDLFRENPDGFDLVITDQTMPQLSGADLTRRILAIRPDFPVILCTGYSDVLDQGKAAEIGARALLLKPLTRTRLAAAVAAVMRGRDSHGPGP